MGFSASIYVVFDCPASKIHQKLNLKPTDEFMDFPDSPISGATTKDGAYVLYVNDRQVFGEDLIRPLEPHAKILACNVNETVMLSAAYLSENGREEWVVLHDSNLGIEHLEITGEMPQAFHSIRKQKIIAQHKEQQERRVDHIFDIPVDLFACLGGMRYNEDLDSTEEKPWQALSQISKGRWWFPFSL